MMQPLEIKHIGWLLYKLAVVVYASIERSDRAELPTKQRVRVFGISFLILFF